MQGDLGVDDLLNFYFRTTYAFKNPANPLAHTTYGKSVAAAMELFERSTRHYRRPEWGIDSVVISGTTTENCCHATARDAMFHNYKVAFLSDATGTFDYPDVGQGAMSAAQVHKATLTILAFSTAHVMTVEEFRALVKTAAA